MKLIKKFGSVALIALFIAFLMMVVIILFRSSFVMVSILLFLSIVLTVISLILGVIGLIKDKSKKLAIISLVLSCISLIFIVLVFILGAGPGTDKWDPSCAGFGGVCKKECDYSLGELMDVSSTCPTNQVCCRTLTSSGNAE